MGESQSQAECLRRELYQSVMQVAILMQALARVLNRWRWMYSTFRVEFVASATALVCPEGDCEVLM